MKFLLGRVAIYAEVIGLATYVALLISLAIGWRQVDTPFMVATFGAGMLLMDLIHRIIRNLERQLRDKGIDPEDVYREWRKRWTI